MKPVNEKDTTMSTSTDLRCLIDRARSRDLQVTAAEMPGPDGRQAAVWFRGLNGERVGGFPAHVDVVDFDDFDAVVDGARVMRGGSMTVWDLTLTADEWLIRTGMGQQLGGCGRIDTVAAKVSSDNLTLRGAVRVRNANRILPDDRKAALGA